MNLSSLARRLFAIGGAAVALAALPAAANAQPLNSVAIATDASAHYLVLDVKGGSTRPGAEVIQWYGTGGSNQRWNFVKRPDGTQQIVNQQTGMCLTTTSVAGENLYMTYCTGSPQQEWKGDLRQVLGGGFSAGSHLINPSSGLSADIFGGSGLAGANLIGWYTKSAVNQQFAYYQLG